MDIPVNANQLCWLDETSSRWFIDIRIQPVGISEPNRGSWLLNNTIFIEELTNIKAQYSNDNIWRSWVVYEDKRKHKPIGPIPFIVDIDDENDPPCIDNAYTLTKTCIEALKSRTNLITSKEQIRVVFSGKKGFHLEIKPSTPINMQDARKHLLIACEEAGLPRNNNAFFDGKTILDTINMEEKPWVRVTNTVYSWYSEGILNKRKIFQMSVDQFLDYSTNAILSLSLIA